ncbi:TonB-dependent receptor plug domain-containing protein [Alkalilimnicola sp. S0819]|uniref:TonB-dependent receptor plug domain-containing protein n=1 Tax=Alkalilimnicola sp. S0819 TaxID=2613922 RepID=UPI00186A3739|nr:TonB-dependent receptor [Alkalilimnicola sp. S0819]
MQYSFRETDSGAVRARAPAAALAALLVLTASPAGANGHRLEPIRVADEPIEESLSGELGHYGNRVEVISRAQIERLGVTDTAQALQMLVPGLYIAPKHGRFDYVHASLQGSRTEDILWLVDGVRINNRLFGGTSPLDSLPANMIERIEVLKGGQSLFYGTQALGGVVNIITRGFAEQTEGQFGQGAGSLGERQVNGYVRGGGGRHRYVLFGSHASADGYTPYRDEHIEPSARGGGTKRGYRVGSLGGKYRREFAPGQMLTLQYIHNDARVDHPAPTDRHTAYNERDEDILIAKWDHLVSDSFGYYLKAYYHDWSTDYTELHNQPGGGLAVINDADPWGYEDYGINAMGRWFLPDHSELVFGLDWQAYSGNDAVLLIDTRTEHVGALFAQYRPWLSFSPDTMLALGVRANKAELGGENLTWNLSARHPIADHQYLRASLGTAFKLPSAYHLYARDPDHPRGNEDLDGEESLNIDLGWGGAARLGQAAFDWELTAFAREIDELIARVSSGGSSTYVNSDEAVRMVGAEAVFTVRPVPGWYGRLSATWSRARARGDDRQIDRVPEYQAKAAFGYDAPGERYGAQLALLHVGPVYQQLGGVGRERYGDYTLVDLSAWYRFGAQRRHRLSLRLENAGDVQYASSVSRGRRDVGNTPYRYDNLGTPRNLQLRYTYDF